jgi:chaperonin GroES
MSAQAAARKKAEVPAAGAGSRIRPLHDRLLVRRIEQPEQVRGGIVIPDTAKEKPQEAEVIAVGPGKLDEEGCRMPMDVRPGDRVLIGKYAGTDVKIADEDLVILREEDVLALIGRQRKSSSKKARSGRRGSRPQQSNRSGAA